MSACSIRLWHELPGPTINPNIYGHFTEHLGRCIYEGIWVGPRSKIPNEDGVRLDVLAALKQLRAPLIRWPGGCFADTYHWKDGVGPRDERPQTANIRWRQAEPNTFGTDEFLRFCAAAGSEPYFCLNVGSGSVREAVEWVEYCNHGGDTSLTRRRTGAPRPVKYWGVGNEPWGCGGSFRAEAYATEYARYATFLRAADPELELVAAGCSATGARNGRLTSWNLDLCQAMPHAELIDHLSMHHIFTRGSGHGFEQSDYHSLFGDISSLEHELDQAERLLAYFYPHKHVGIALDEWGVWHPEATVDNGLEQANTLRDAVFAGSVLNLLNRHAGRVTMANLAQTINVLHSLGITEGGRMTLTPTYHVYDMMRYHMGARLVVAEVECPGYTAHPAGLGRECRVAQLSASASIAGSKVLLTVANQTYGEDVEAQIAIKGAKISTAVGRVLNAVHAHDSNTFSSPKTVFPKRIKLDPVKGELTCVFPAHSFTSLNLSLA